MFRKIACFGRLIGLSIWAACARDAGLTYASWGFDLTAKDMIDMMRFHHPDDLAHLREGLRQAGLPD